MDLLDLPIELILMIEKHLPTQANVSALMRSNSGVLSILQKRLYRPTKWSEVDSNLRRACERGNEGLASNLRQYSKEANEWLKKFPPFQAYLQQVTAGFPTAKFDPSPIGPDLWGAGIFEVPATEQTMIISALSKEGAQTTKKSKRLIDEDSVNLSLVAFLIAVAAKYPSVHSRWAPYRKPIKAQFGKLDNSRFRTRSAY